jgi:hypothetical protein
VFIFLNFIGYWQIIIVDISRVHSDTIMYRRIESSYISWKLPPASPASSPGSCSFCSSALCSIVSSGSLFCLYFVRKCFLLYHLLYLFFDGMGGVGFELRASWLLSTLSTTWITLSALFMLSIFEIGSHSMPGLAWTVILLFVLPGMTGAHRSTQPLLGMGSCEFFLAWDDLEPQFSQSPPKQLGLQVWDAMLSLSSSFFFTITII